MLVLHYTGMETGQAALERMCDPDAKVSAHYMVEEDGRVFSLVAEDKRAWHAGLSSWRGITDLNSASIGIEIVNGGHDFGLPDYPDVQIEAVIQLCQDILSRHTIHPLDVIGHSDIAPERKQDPGEKFPWERLAASGVGYWIEDVEEAEAISSTDWVIRNLTACGYDPASGDLETILTAFQRHHCPAHITGQADLNTASLLAGLAKANIAAGLDRA